MVMENNFFRYWKPQHLAGVILIIGTAVSYSLAWIVPILTNKLNFSYYQFPATSAIVLLILSLINKHWWKYFPFRYFFWVPDMSGRYEGFIRYQLNGIEEEKLCSVEVVQDGLKVKVNSYFQKSNGSEKSLSKSLVETIVSEDDGNYSIALTYRNQGITGKFPEHCGTNILKFINNSNGKFLKGDYYTNRQPQTKGIMEVKLVTNKLKNDY
jgi:hypothetical protein